MKPTYLLAALITLSVSVPGAHALLPVRNSDAAPQAQPSGFGPLDPAPPSNGLTPEALIAKFGERESAFAKARDEYTFRQTVKIQTINDDTAKPDGTYQQVTDIVFSENGARTEHVVFAPANTIERLIMTESDFDDIAHRLPFVLTTPELPQYNLTYLGRQRVDDIETYVFDCKPKTLEKGKRYFQGRVWVDQQQFEIVLINGKSVPDNLKRGHEDLSPPYTTYYQEVDGGNWFPVYTKADGTLHFPPQDGAPGQDVHIRYVVKYEDYKRFHAKSRIIYNGEALAPAPPSATGAAGTTTSTAQSADATPAGAPPPDPDAPALTRPKPPK
jgi:hypothetical protein